eukprot:s261_g25.t1
MEPCAAGGNIKCVELCRVVSSCLMFRCFVCVLIHAFYLYTREFCGTRFSQLFGSAACCHCTSRISSCWIPVFVQRSNFCEKCRAFCLLTCASMNLV